MRGEWVRFSLTGRAYMPLWGASSVLESDDPLSWSRYGADKALDGDPATAWVEGAPGPGIGESYILAVEHFPEALGFINGYAKNRNLFEKNYRVKELRVHVYTALTVDGFYTERMVFLDGLPAARPRIVSLRDTMGPQRVTLPFDRRQMITRMEEFKSSEELETWSFPQAETMGLDGSEGRNIDFHYVIKLEIVDTYRGSTWEDTCIAELWTDYGDAAGVSESKDRRSLLMITAEGEEIPSYSEFEYVVTLVDTSTNYEWALVIHEPAYLEPGERATSTYAVIHLPSGRNISSELFEEPELLGMDLLPTGLIQENGKTYLEYEDFAAGESTRVLCGLYAF